MTYLLALIDWAHSGLTIDAGVVGVAGAVWFGVCGWRWSKGGMVGRR